MVTFMQPKGQAIFILPPVFAPYIHMYERHPRRRRRRRPHLSTPLEEFKNLPHRGDTAIIHSFPISCQTTITSNCDAKCAAMVLSQSSASKSQWRRDDNCVVSVQAGLLQSHILFWPGAD